MHSDVRSSSVWCSTVSVGCRRAGLINCCATSSRSCSSSRATTSPVPSSRAQSKALLPCSPRTAGSAPCWSRSLTHSVAPTHAETISAVSPLYTNRLKLVQNIAVDIMLQEELQDSGVPVASGAVQCSGPTTMLPFGDDSLAPVADDPLAGLQVVINDSNTEIGHLVCTRHQAGKTQAKIHQHTHTSVTSRSTQLTTQAELS
eukprot:m.315306 g.315306  ORF g.315306 m.315306 type:complete len:202 (-) comp55433_c0_seq14:197-802(-)